MRAHFPMKVSSMVLRVVLVGLNFDEELRLLGKCSAGVKR
jgi:hypothetical protein